MNDSLHADDSVINKIVDELPRDLRKLSYTTEEASRVLATFGVQFARTTLNKLRCVSSDGPPFRKTNGSIRYDREPLINWGLTRRGPELRSTAKK